MKAFLTLIASALVMIGATSVLAQESDMSAGEALVESTETMAAESEAAFDQAVDCADEAMSDDIVTDDATGENHEATEGEEKPATDCVSKKETNDTEAPSSIEDAPETSETME